MRDLQAAGLCPVCSLNLARFQDRGYTSFMRKLLTTTLLLAAALCQAAASTYDIGGGRQLVLDENGTYSIIQTEFDTSPLVGRQFVIDYDALIDTAVDLAVAEEPSLLILGRDTLSALVEELGLIDEFRAQVPDFSLIFISEDRVVATMAIIVGGNLSYYKHPSEASASRSMAEYSRKPGESIFKVCD